MEKVHVKILRKVVQTREHRGTKGEVILVPKDIAEEWINAKHAEAAPAPAAEPKAE